MNDFAKLVAPFAFVIASTAHAASLDAKPGTWEMTIRMGGSGSTIPPDVLAKMPPDRRAMAEKMMAGEGRMVTRKSCIKQQDLDEARFGQRERENCKVDVVSRTATKVVAKSTCTDPKSQGTISFEAKDREHVVGTIDQEREGGGKFHVDIAGKWLSAGCEGTDPPVATKKN